MLMTCDIDDLIRRVEEIRADPDDHKDYENTYEDGWLDACYTVLGMLDSLKAKAQSADTVTLPADLFDALSERINRPSEHCPAVARVLGTQPPWE